MRRDRVPARLLGGGDDAVVEARWCTSRPICSPATMHAALIEPSPWDTDELPDQPPDPDDPDPAPDGDEVGGGCAAAGR